MTQADRDAQQCTGPFSDAHDCPIHDPRKRDTGIAPDLLDARALAAKQAEDDGLWFVAQTASEAYLQQELRKLHAAVERPTTIAPDLRGEVIALLTDWRKACPCDEFWLCLKCQRAEALIARLKAEPPSAIQRVVALLKRADAIGLESPTVLQDEGTVLDFNWDRGVSAVLSVSVYPNADIGWAALIGEWKSHGRESGWPDQLDEALRKLSEVGVADA